MHEKLELCEFRSVITHDEEIKRSHINMLRFSFKDFSNFSRSCDDEIATFFFNFLQVLVGMRSSGQ